MMIGATRDTALAYRVGMAIAYQCKRIGVTIDFAPDVDVNNNSGNPVNQLPFVMGRIRRGYLSLA